MELKPRSSWLLYAALAFAVVAMLPLVLFAQGILLSPPWGFCGIGLMGALGFGRFAYLQNHPAEGDTPRSGVWWIFLVLLLVLFVGAAGLYIFSWFIPGLWG